jgi:dTDP-glucose 4,6-dehydratase
MRILVTGGAGFIGSAVCRHLVAEAGAKVLNIDKLTYAANARSLDAIAGSSGYRFMQMDICDETAVALALDSFQPEAIIHLAAESHVDRSIGGADEFIETNIVGTFRLLEAARRYWARMPRAARSAFRFLHVSTDEVYGSLGPDGLFREDTAYNPSSPYSASKAASNHLVLAWHRTHKLPTLLSNATNTYGPYQFPEKLIPLTILNACHGQPLPLYGDGLNVRDWLYVEDHARALVHILVHGRIGEIYNIGGRNEQTNLSVVQRICSLMDEMHPAGRPHSRLITFVPDRPGHDRRYAIDPGKLETTLGWRPQENFASGLEKTVRWYLANADWWQQLRNGPDLDSSAELSPRDTEAHIFADA